MERRPELKFVCEGSNSKFDIPSYESWTGEKREKKVKAKNIGGVYVFIVIINELQNYFIE